MVKDLNEISINRKVIQNHVINRICRDPITVAFVGIGVALLLGGMLIGMAWEFTIAGLVLVPAGCFLNYRFRHQEFAKQFLDEVAETLERKRQRRFGEIRADLYDLAKNIPAKDEEGDLASQALEQFGQLHEKFELFLEVLERKFHPGELAYVRYLEAANQFFMKIMSHLSRTGEILQLISHSEGFENRQSEVERVKKFLGQNAEALLAFDKTTTGMTLIKDMDGAHAEDIEVIIDQLEQLARQAERLGEI